jgi:alkylation response protein AidB-like acyl-CoA dehydrogenase
MPGIEVLRFTAYRSLSATEKHGQPGPEGSLLKWMWSTTNQELTQFAVATLGPLALFDDSRWSFELLRARGNTIEGGTTEILKNIVAERVLGLPKGR